MVLNPADERPDLAHCASCQTAYLHGLAACPHCGSPEVIEPGTPWPPAEAKPAGKEAGNGVQAEA